MEHAKINDTNYDRYVSDGCKDYSLGAQICATIAKKVYRELSDEMLLLLTKGGNFYWTQSPQVSPGRLLLS